LSCANILWPAQIENRKIRKFSINSELIKENRENYLAVRIYKIQNETGST